MQNILPALLLSLKVAGCATLMIAGSIPNETQTLSIAVYEAVQAGDDDLANQLVIIISLVCVAILWLTQYLSKPRYQS